MMSQAILVPFDGSPPAEAALRSAVVLAERDGARIVVAVPSLSDEGFVGTLEEARQIVGAAALVEGRRIGVGASGEPFRALVQELDPSDVVVPLAPQRGSRALQAMTRAALLHPTRPTVAVDVRGIPEPAPQHDHREKEEGVHERRGLAAAYRVLLRGSVRVRMGIRAIVR